MYVFIYSCFCVHGHFLLFYKLNLIFKNAKAYNLLHQTACFLKVLSKYEENSLTLMLSFGLSNELKRIFIVASGARKRVVIGVVVQNTP